MNRHDVAVALTKAHTSSPAAVGLGKCDLADAVYAFLTALEGRSSWWMRILIRAIHGAISDWKRSEGCP